MNTFFYWLPLAALMLMATLKLMDALMERRHKARWNARLEALIARTKQWSTEDEHRPDDRQSVS